MAEHRAPRAVKTKVSWTSGGARGKLDEWIPSKYGRASAIQGNLVTWYMGDNGDVPHNQGLANNRLAV